jgi:hypothetical protein
MAYLRAAWRRSDARGEHAPRTIIRPGDDPRVPSAETRNVPARSLGHARCKLVEVEGGTSLGAPKP